MPRGEGVARAGVEPATFRFSGGRSYQLSYLAAADARIDGRPSAGQLSCRGPRQRLPDEHEGGERVPPPRDRETAPHLSSQMWRRLRPRRDSNPRPSP